LIKGNVNNGLPKCSRIECHCICCILCPVFAFVNPAYFFLDVTKAKMSKQDEAFFFSLLYLVSIEYFNAEHDVLILYNV
jgi:hypothetical protein